MTTQTNEIRKAVCLLKQLQISQEISEFVRDFKFFKKWRILHFDCRMKPGCNV